MRQKVFRVTCSSCDFAGKFLDKKDAKKFARKHENETKHIVRLK
ncbi:MAG: hypothetical protein ACYDAP_00305 [Thermoplasmataceae archaeon]